MKRKKRMDTKSESKISGNNSKHDTLLVSFSRDSVFSRDLAWLEREASAERGLRADNDSSKAMISQFNEKT